jgi:hypothetical protein
MVTRPVFSRVRKEMLLAVLATGAVTLGACSSNSATYRPAPQAQQTTTARPPASQPTYTQPAVPTYRAPAAPPAGGQTACGKGGKCG